MRSSGCYLTVDLTDGVDASDEARGIARLLDILEDAPGDRRATFFTTVDAAEAETGLLVRLGRLGHEIGCLGGAGGGLVALDPAGFARSGAEAKALIEAATGQMVVGFRAPELADGQRRWPLEALAAAGFAYDSSLLGVRRRAAGTPYDAYGFPAGTLYEFPLHQAALPGGLRLGVIGGRHLRLLPLALLLKLLARAAAKGYVPVVSVGPADLAAAGRGRTSDRLARVLAAFPNRGPLAESVPGLASVASLRRAAMRLIA